MSSKKTLADRILSGIERAGNALPDPGTLFVLFAIAVLLFSWVLSLFDLSAFVEGSSSDILKAFKNHPFRDKLDISAGGDHTRGGVTFPVINLFSKDGLHLILKKTVTNFTEFPPLGTVLVALLGIGIAEGSGLIGTFLRLVVINSPKRLLSFVVVFAGVLSNTASEVGYVLLVPLAAQIFHAAGKNPLAGLAAAFAGVSGGYSANLLLSPLDPLLAGISEGSAGIISSGYDVSPTCNYYFMAASTFIIAGLGTWVTEKVVIPRLGDYKGEGEVEKIEKVSREEKKGLLYAAISIVILTGVVLLGLIPQNGFLRDLNAESPNDVLKSPFMTGIVTFIFIAAAVAGIAYGVGAKTIKNDKDVINGMAKSMQTLGTYIVLVFFAAQFVAYFNWSFIGVHVAVNGAALLESLNLSAIPLMLGLIIFSAFVNMVMGSASAKWAILAPIFVPMFMLLGYSPEFTQLAYRIGDSTTNIITPMMTYFALIVAFVGRYDKRAGLGTVISLMLPYSIAFMLGWIVLLIFWYLLGLPVGPGAPLIYGA